MVSLCLTPVCVYSYSSRLLLEHFDNLLILLVSVSNDFYFSVEASKGVRLLCLSGLSPVMQSQTISPCGIVESIPYPFVNYFLKVAFLAY